MSSVQTGQLISLLINNVLMVLIVAVVTLGTWLRWQWLRGQRTRSGRRRCRWAYGSFVLMAVTLLGMLVSLGLLALRALLASNALVAVAMGIFVLSVVTLLLGLGLWLLDLCCDLPVTQRRQSELGVSSVPTLVSESMAKAAKPSRGARRTQRRQMALRSKG